MGEWEVVKEEKIPKEWQVSGETPLDRPTSTITGQPIMTSEEKLAPIGPSAKEFFREVFSFCSHLSISSMTFTGSKFFVSGALTSCFFIEAGVLFIKFKILKLVIFMKIKVKLNLMFIVIKFSSE